jgi:hydroxypyruvate reductase
MQVLEAYGGVWQFPPAVVARLEAGTRGEVPETPKPNVRPHAPASARVVGGRRDAMYGAADEARRLGYSVHIHEAPVVGDARAAARGRLASVYGVVSQRPACVISSGETTVQVTGGGRGGRNQEFALAASDLAAVWPGPAAVASVGTDGRDGPTDAAGALVDSSTAARARERGLNPQTFLGNNDSYTFFEALGDLIHTGSTGTNVGDLQVILLA